MDGRRLLAERGLAGRAVAALTRHALGELPADSLGRTKALLKQFFSYRDWGPAEAEALAEAVGPGHGWWAEPLDGGLTLEFGWPDGRFVLRVAGAAEGAEGSAGPRLSTGLEASFAGPVVPEATPNPRTIAFRTGTLHDGASRSYASAADAHDDGRVARLFEAFPDLATVLVARDFVALTVGHPSRWEDLLAPALRAVTEEFAGAGAGGSDPVPSGRGAPPAPVPGAPPRGTAGRAAPAARETRLDRAWRRLGRLRATDPADLEAVVAASRSRETAERQVAAALLKDAPAAAAAEAWSRLAVDPSRRVRRAAVDSMADAGRASLRPLLEGALGDADAWVRWKALRGLVDLGAEASRPAIEPLAEDPDFRVRLEAHGVLRPPA